MAMMAKRVLGAALIAAGVMAMPAMAQLSADGGPVKVNAAKADVLEKERQVRYVGAVDIVQGDARLVADEVTLYFKPRPAGAGGGVASGFGEIDRMVAEGNVYYRTPDVRTRGNRGTYKADEDTIVLTGNVILARCGDVARGEKLTVKVSEGRTSLDGGAGRVQMVISSGGDVSPGTQGCPQ